LKDLSEYIGIPFLSKGRNTSGIDCYGLTRLVLRNVYGKELPDFYYPDAMDKKNIRKLLDQNQPLLAGTETDEPEEGDIAIMKYGGIPCHIGIYVGEGKILHIRVKTDSILERVGSARLKARIAGYYKID